MKVSLNYVFYKEMKEPAFFSSKLAWEDKTAKR